MPAIVGRRLTGVPAMRASRLRILLTASAWMPLLMNSSPSMKMPRPPTTGTITWVNMFMKQPPPSRRAAHARRCRCWKVDVTVP
ncbi:hypothetical protein D3C83_127300 [compost metagenome]